MTPYLQAVTADSIYVLVESDSTIPVTAEYGKSPSYDHQAVTEKIEPTTAFPRTYVHKIRFTRLEADTQYHYRVYQGREYSTDHTFWTAANPGTGFPAGRGTERSLARAARLAAFHRVSTRARVAD